MAFKQNNYMLQNQWINRINPLKYLYLIRDGS